jgi:hypothetical protein
MDLSMHDAFDALGKWVPLHERLIQRWGGGGMQQGLRDDLSRLRVALLASAGHRAWADVWEPLPQQLVDDATQIAMRVGIREIAGGYTLKEPGSTYQSLEAPADEPLRLRRSGGDSVDWVLFSRLPGGEQAGIALRVWSEAVVALVAYEASGGDAELLRRADWWLCKAASAWSTVKGTDWGALVPSLRELTLAHWKNHTEIAYGHEKVFAHQNFDELLSWQSVGQQPPIARIFLGEGVSDALIVITRAVAAHALAAHSASVSGFEVPGIDDHGQLHDRMASYLGRQLFDALREARKSGGYESTGFADSQILDLLDGTAGPDGITPIGKAAN